MDTSYGRLWPSTFPVSYPFLCIDPLFGLEAAEKRRICKRALIGSVPAPETDCSCIRVLCALHPHDGSTSPNYARQAACQRLNKSRSSEVCHHGSDILACNLEETPAACLRKTVLAVMVVMEPARKRVGTYASPSSSSCISRI
jgi:hypothetical protein